MKKDVSCRHSYLTAVLARSGKRRVSVKVGASGGDILAKMKAVKA